MVGRLGEHSLNDQEFQFICQLVYKASGIVLDERKREMVYRRLMRRTRSLKVASFSQYCQLLASGDENELPNFINSITTNLTSFFRENHHFEYLNNTFLPEHTQQFGHTKRLRIWSTASSTGEEPYSLAITLSEYLAIINSHWDAKILATDLDTDVLHIAKTGIYKQDRIKDLSSAHTKKWFKQGRGDNEGMVKVHPTLQQLLTFKPLNLLHQWPMKGPFDVIMCRNVLIYFDKATQQQLIQRFYDLIRPGGLLILGHSESLSKNNCKFKIEGRTIFKKPYSSDTNTRVPVS